MDTTAYVTLSRQSGLRNDMQSVAHNIANAATSGYRREGLIFAEMVEAVRAEGRSVAMTATYARTTDTTQGALQKTGGTFDLALEGPGFFTVDTPAGQRLTRAGSFTRNELGELVSNAGHRLLDTGGAPIFVPPGARTIAIAGDGTLSADGAAVAQIGVVGVEEPWRLSREDGVLFNADGAEQPLENAQVVQGFLEKSNVNPVTEIARMIAVQRAYEAGQKLLDREDERIRQVITVVTQNS